MKKLLLLALALTLLGLAGCSEEAVLAPDSGAGNDLTATVDKSNNIEFQDGTTPPAGLVPIAVGDGNLVCWPFTGNSFNGMGVDPVNLIFTGNADPLQIREALLSLDGDRSALGLPPVYPFDQRWHDALGGGVQTSYDDQGGWLGSVIQLSLGNYDPVRFHLRLFRTGATTANGEAITLGAAHFEVKIPGTSEHQVLSWEVAEQIVAGDMMRSGLLDPSQHIGQTGQINDAPSWRTINPSIYNGLPAGLIAIIGGPAQPQTDPVPIATDGHATTIHLAGALPITPMEYSATASIDFGQFVPRPFCSTGPYDWLHITGGVEFVTNVVVDADGRYSYKGDYTGTIFATPLDISTGQPVGEPFYADVRGSQQGWMTAWAAKVAGSDRKLSHESGPQLNNITLRVGENGAYKYSQQNNCLTD
ncbi:MAG: hypothetical protein ACI9JE_001185 [Candidatus Krumholzibacteriia bacterium]|jgi:hypothetical protein